MSRTRLVRNRQVCCAAHAASRQVIYIREAAKIAATADQLNPAVAYVPPECGASARGARIIKAGPSKTAYFRPDARAPETPPVLWCGSTDYETSSSAPVALTNTIFCTALRFADPTTAASRLNIGVLISRIRGFDENSREVNDGISSLKRRIEAGGIVVRDSDHADGIAGYLSDSVRQREPSEQRRQTHLA